MNGQVVNFKHTRKCKTCMVPFTTTEKSEHKRPWCFDCSPERVWLSEKEKKQIVRAGTI